MDYFKKAMEPVSQPGPEPYELLAEQSSFATICHHLPRCLGDSGLPKSKISDVVLVGGSTRALDFDDVLIDSDGATKVNHGVAMLSSVMVVAQQG